MPRLRLPRLALVNVELKRGLVLVSLLILTASCSSGPTSSSSGSSGKTHTTATAAPATTLPRPESSTRPDTSAPTTSLASGASQGAQSHCRSGDPLADVYHPYRLQVLRDCLAVTGTVVAVRYEDDGDYHVNLALSSAEQGLVNSANQRYEGGDLVTEIVPADKAGCTRGQAPPLPPTAYRTASYDYGICTGADLAPPPIGATVTVVGPYVVDSDHGWAEIHPVWWIGIGAGGPSGPPPPATVASASPTATAATGASCQVTVAPANDGYAGDEQVSVSSNQRYARATASDAGDTWSESTNSSGAAQIRLYNTRPGMEITVTVGGATCSKTA